MKKSIYLNKNRSHLSPLAIIGEFVETQMNASPSGGMIDRSLAESMLGLESLDQMQTASVDNALSSFNTALESTLGQIETATQHKFTVAQRDSAVIAGVFASNPAVALESKVASFDSSTPYIKNSAGIERPALEGYDDRNNKVTARYTLTYNLYAPRQNPFAETLFPTVTIPPDQPGFTTSIDLCHIIDQVRRSTTGGLDDYGRMQLLHALRDPSILRNDATAVIPVYRNNTKHLFVDENVLAPSTIRKNKEEITTQPLAFGVPAFSLLGVSQTDLELSMAEFDHTDVLDTALRLEKVYLQVGNTLSTEVIRFDTSSIAGSVFNETPQGDDRKMVLNLTMGDLLINKNTVLSGGGALNHLAPIVTGNFAVRLKVSVSMSVILDTSDFESMVSPVQVMEVIDSAGQSHAPTSAAVAPIVALFTEMRLIGYDVAARRINSNRRTVAQMLDSRIYNQNYAIPTYAPFMITRPQTAGDQNDTGAVNALIQASRALTQAHAVWKLLEADNILNSAVDKRRSIHTVTELMGVARLVTTPFYERHDVEVQNARASIKSHEVAADARAVLVNLIRDIAFRAYRDSGLQIALDAAYNGAAPKPTVILATDPYIEQYLHVTGDLRTLADKFEVKIVSTPVLEMQDIIFMTFGNFDPALEGQPNPFHFGNMAWRPETVVALPGMRNGQHSMELTACATFLHVVNLPVLARINVTGLREAMTNKPIIGFEDVTPVPPAPAPGPAPSPNPGP